MQESPPEDGEEVQTLHLLDLVVFEGDSLRVLEWRCFGGGFEREGSQDC